MRVEVISPAGRTLVQGLTAPHILFNVTESYAPDPSLATARFDLVDASSLDRVIDGKLATISNITSLATDYGTAYSFQLRYDFVAGDLNITGTHDAYFRLTFGGGEEQMFPSMARRMYVFRRAGSVPPVTGQANVSQEVRVDMPHTFVLGDVIYPTGPSTWALADASDFATLGSAVVSHVEDAGAFWYTGPGALISFPTDQGWTPSGALYLDPDNIGKVTQAAPAWDTHPGKWLQTLGSADDTMVWSFQHYESRRL